MTATPLLTAEPDARVAPTDWSTATTSTGALLNPGTGGVRRTRAAVARTDEVPSGDVAIRSMRSPATSTEATGDDASSTGTATSPARSALVMPASSAGTGGGGVLCSEPSASSTPPPARSAAMRRRWRLLQRWTLGKRVVSNGSERMRLTLGAWAGWVECLSTGGGSGDPAPQVSGLRRGGGGAAARRRLRCARCGGVTLLRCGLPGVGRAGTGRAGVGLSRVCRG